MQNKRVDQTHYFIRVHGKLVPVNKAIYSEYYRMYRRERYLEERDITHGKILYSDLDNSDLLGEELMFDTNTESVEQIVINKVMIEKLVECLNLLCHAERMLIDALFYNGMTEREYSAVSGIPQQTINSQKAQLLEKLKKLVK